MGYYMRYLLTTDAKLTLDELETALKQVDTKYQIRRDPILPLFGTLLLGKYICGELEINFPGDEDGIFEEDIEEMRDLITESGQDSETKVRDVLDKTTCIIALNAVWQGNDPDVTLDKMEPLWSWLFDHHLGLLQADSEGFFERDTLIFETNLKI